MDKQDWQYQRAYAEICIIENITNHTLDIVKKAVSHSPVFPIDKEMKKGLEMVRDAIDEIFYTPLKNAQYIIDKHEGMYDE